LDKGRNKATFEWYSAYLKGITFSIMSSYSRLLEDGCAKFLLEIGLGRAFCD